MLTRSDVDVNHINNLGWTALLEAVILGDGGPRHQQIVALLLQYGAEPQIADRDGITPLVHARQHQYAEMERLLTEV
nr:ankyrin repeat domain-containing protein [Paenibacillus sp. 1781tsa1]